MTFVDTEGLRILIVEDDIIDRKLLQRLLSESRLDVAKVIAADRLAEALNILNDNTFDVVLLDLGLPDSSGIDSFTELQSFIPHVPIIVLSGLDDQDMAINAVQKGVQDYLIKGKVDSDLLTRSVKYAIERKKTEGQLQEAEQRYRTIFDNSAVAIMMVDEQERLISWNKFTENLLGMNHDDLHLRHIKTLYPQDEWYKIRAHDIRQKGMQHHLETRMMRKSGEVIDVDISLSVVRDKDDNITGSIGVVRDITERRQAEERLESSYSLLHATLESTADGILVVNNEGNVISYNQKFIEIWGIPGNIIAKGSDSLIAFILEHLKTPIKFLDEINEFGEGSIDNNYDTFELKDGRAFERYSQPQMIGDTVRGRVWSFRDVTEKRRIHEILDKKQKNLEAIFDAAPIGMLLINDQMKVTRANEVIRQIAHKEYSDIIGKYPGCAVGCKYAQDYCAENKIEYGSISACSDCVLKNAMISVHELNESIHSLETQLDIKNDNEEYKSWFSISVEPVYIDGKKHALIALHDITDRKRAELELKDTMEIKAQFISTVSHELRTPLTSMREAVIIVLDEVAGKINEDQKNFLGVAKRNIDRLARLINDVLDFQKLGSGKMKFNMQENDIKRVIEEAYTTMQPFANKKHVNLLLLLEDNMPNAVFDSDRIIQVLTNLVSNAIKFTPAKGTVSISSKIEDKQLVLSVSDTGMGIPKEALPKIFDRFYRVYRPGQEIKGTGLGLAIVNKIIDVHGGRIDVQSQENQGTTFTVYLPLDANAVGEKLDEDIDKKLESTLIGN